MREKAAQLGIAIDAGIGVRVSAIEELEREGGERPEAVLKGLRVAKAVGATSMRCFMGR